MMISSVTATCSKSITKFLSQPDIAVVAGGITEKYKNNPKSKNVGKFHFYTATPERGFHINHKEYVDHGGGGNYSIKKKINVTTIFV